MSVKVENLNHGDIILVNDTIGLAIHSQQGFRFWDHKDTLYSPASLPVIDSYVEATHEQKVDFLVKHFSWGEIQSVHSIGSYVVIEAKTREGRIRFYGYINYRDQSRSYSTLDRALVGLIAIKYDGINTQADSYFARSVLMS